MEPSSLFYILSFIIFAIVSGFFSGTEVAFFSLSAVELARLREEHTKAAQRVLKLMNDSRKLLITILIGNTVVNICAAIIATLFVTQISREYQFSESVAVLLEVVVVTMIILIFSEILPKVVAVRNAQYFAYRVSFLIEIIYIIFYPLSTALERFTNIFVKLFKLKGERYFLSEEEIKTLIELSEEKGTIHFEEKQMIDSIFEFGQTAVREIMVPRIDMVCVNINTSMGKLVSIIREKGHTRIPVFEERIDFIKGIIHAKDLIPFLDSKSDKIDLHNLARPAYFVPESKKIDDLLREFQKEKVHMAIVVDEYGGTAGLVTLEDILEEIVGEIQDEYDKEQPLYRMISHDTFMADGRISIEELNQVLPEPIPQNDEEDFESLGGLIFHITGSVPQKNDHVKFHNYDFIIEDVDQQRIKKVKIIKINRLEEMEENNSI